jgi:hypothetical protein
MGRPIANQTARSSGSDRPAVPSAQMVLNTCPLPFGEAERTKSTSADWNQLDVTTSVLLSILPHTRMILLQETHVQCIGQVLTL